MTQRRCSTVTNIGSLVLSCLLSYCRRPVGCSAATQLELERAAFNGLEYEFGFECEFEFEFEFELILEFEQAAKSRAADLSWSHLRAARCKEPFVSSCRRRPVLFSVSISVRAAAPWEC